ncbi:Holliday junction resolvase RuvX [Arcicella sp. DC2W]|uniref:Putative pre-16S rRNA nuclease n=1 Tax=Arcicella gelida TaxID=2984195 RepID=A0ABU5S6E2_9BACT|nr:Holliday junction resolvase RuvX [Arcicella sp. DC2W]MEA5403946.1 Holliday junction resolvase RuvX [Arcicella sp. DC2W]
MGRILAIDYGSKRVGLAVTDPLKIIASALDTVHSKDVLEFLKAYIAREEVEAIVVGMPINLDGEDTNNTPQVKGFVKGLKKAFPEMPIHLHDERFTSSMAMSAMIASGYSKKDRREKGNIDKISATIILQSFMESKGM